jgi:hypothetical protein
MRALNKDASMAVLTLLWVLANVTFPIARGWCAAKIKWDLTKQADVEAYVDELTGFGALEGTAKAFARVDVNDDNTPFLHAQINGKKNVWRVEFQNVRLKLKSAVPGFKDRYVRTFEVLIDPNSGHLLRIRSTFDGNDPNMRPEPPAVVAERHLSKAKELYHGFPSEPAKMSLIDALDAIGAGGIGSPFLAKEIYAVYVLHSRRGAKIQPVWAVTLRGLPPRPLKGKPLPLIDTPDEELSPVWQRNHIRNVVDANTGKVMFATSRPHPLPPKAKDKNK